MQIRYKNISKLPSLSFKTMTESGVFFSPTCRIEVFTISDLRQPNKSTKEQNKVYRYHTYSFKFLRWGEDLRFLCLSLISAVCDCDLNNLLLGGVWRQLKQFWGIWLLLLLNNWEIFHTCVWLQRHELFMNQFLKIMSSNKASLFTSFIMMVWPCYLIYTVQYYVCAISIPPAFDWIL